MRILYGVQGTGNGHLSRARAMARGFAAHAGVEVDWLFSGRAPGDFFDMACFGPWQWQRGLSFAVSNGRIAHLRTLLHLRPLQFLRDVGQLAVEDYDVVITDFEPVTAWAARRKGVPCIGIGHQYAFGYASAPAARGLIGELTLKHYAPVSTAIGLHWHHFGNPVLPPIVDIDVCGLTQPGSRDVLVYLPFEDQASIIALLRTLPDWQFRVFGPRLSNGANANVSTHVAGRRGFLEALAGASHVICNCGFELISEALSLGHRILTKPLRGQLEQLSNALTLDSLGYAQSTARLDRGIIAEFLDRDVAAPCIRWPDVAAALAAWVVRQDEDLESVSTRLWRETIITPAPASPTGS